MLSRRASVAHMVVSVAHMVVEELRRQLAPAVKRSSEHPLVSEDEQIAIVDSLRDRFAHSITLVSRDSEVSRPEGDAVNCYEFALGLFEHPRYWEILSRHGIASPLRDFS